jgi:hypothetical protein
MTISMQTLHDALIALVTTVGIAVTASILLVAAGAVFERSQARAARANRPGAIPAQHPTHIDEVRDLMLR